MPRTVATFLSSDNGIKTGFHSPGNHSCDSRKLRFAIFGCHSSGLSDVECAASACSDGVLGAYFLSDTLRCALPVIRALSGYGGSYRSDADQEVIVFSHFRPPFLLAIIFVKSMLHDLRDMSASSVDQ